MNIDFVYFVLKAFDILKLVALVCARIAVCPYMYRAVGLHVGPYI